MSGFADHDETSIPTEWPRNLNPPPPFYFHRKTLADAAKLRAQGPKRYHRDPEAWIARVRKWQAERPEYVAAYQAWWWRQNRSEARLRRMREYTRLWRLKKKRDNVVAL